MAVTTSTQICQSNINSKYVVRVVVRNNPLITDSNVLPFPVNVYSIGGIVAVGCPFVFCTPGAIVNRGRASKRLRLVFSASLCVGFAVELHTWRVNIVFTARLVDHKFQNLLPEFSTSKVCRRKSGPNPLVNLVELIRPIILEGEQDVCVRETPLLEFDSAQMTVILSKNSSTLYFFHNRVQFHFINTTIKVRAVVRGLPVQKVVLDLFSVTVEGDGNENARCPFCLQ